MRFLRFQSKLGHVVSHWPMQQNLPKFAQNYQNCPKLPKLAKICPKTISLRNFEMPPKFEILVFSKNKNFYV
jgi:hypothetical protein